MPDLRQCARFKVTTIPDKKKPAKRGRGTAKKPAKRGKGAAKIPAATKKSVTPEKKAGMKKPPLPGKASAKTPAATKTTVTPKTKAGMKKPPLTRKTFLQERPPLRVSPRKNPPLPLQKRRPLLPKSPGFPPSFDEAAKINTTPVTDLADTQAPTSPPVTTADLPTATTPLASNKAQLGNFTDRREPK